MLACALGATLLGIDAHPVRVEVDAARGVPSFELVGLAEACVRESRVRVKSALTQVGVDLSEYRLVVNLAPADLRKSGAGFDVAIAVATLARLGVVSHEAIEGVLFLGELSLSGEIQPVRGVLPKLLGASRRGIGRAVVPRKNANEGGLVGSLDVRTAGTLGELMAALRGEHTLPRAASEAVDETPAYGEDLAEVRGQATARRALEIAAAGGHNLLVIAATNPCACGYLGDGVGELQADTRGEPSSQVAERVARARSIQRARFESGETSAPTNGALAMRDLELVAALCDRGAKLLASAVERLSLSARAYGKVLRVARTLADLEGATTVLAPHVAEAIGARVLDRPVRASAAAMVA